MNQASVIEAAFIAWDAEEMDNQVQAEVTQSYNEYR